jgi:hypothetical protein
LNRLIPALLAVFATQGQAQQMETPRAERVAVLQDKRINESSGLARSHLEPGIFWTHNDSASDPCVYAIDKSGKTRAKVRLMSAVNFDWEDMASAKDKAGTSRLYVGDIGDNLLLRPSIQVYQIPEPALPKTADKELLSAEPEIWHGRYPDGRHNAETLLVHPQTGRIYVVTKSEKEQSAVYAFPETLTKAGPMMLEKIADLSFPQRQLIGKRPHDACQTTAGSFSADGSRLAIATYSFIYEWRIKSDESLVEALKKPARLIAIPLIPQLEALCYDADGKTLWFTSERLPAPLWCLVRE